MEEIRLFETNERSSGYHAKYSIHPGAITNKRNDDWPCVTGSLDRYSGQSVDKLVYAVKTPYTSFTYCTNLMSRKIVYFRTRVDFMTSFRDLRILCNSMRQSQEKYLSKYRNTTCLCVNYMQSECTYATL